METWRGRLERQAREWQVTLGDTFETPISIIGYGERAGQPVVLKVVKQAGDEWQAGEVLAAFEGRGVVRVYEFTGGAMLLERLRPGDALADLATGGGDERATEILARVIGTMSPREPAHPCPTVADWSRSFERYAATRDSRIPGALVADAHRVYQTLCVTQAGVRLLHGDLQHYNVLFDADRGWVAIDPKGVIGEIEYEIGAILRNPGPAEQFGQPSVIERRLKRFESALGLNVGRALAWSFAQAVLSAIWLIEDGVPVTPTDPSVLLAQTLRPMVSFSRS